MKRISVLVVLLLLSRLSFGREPVTNGSEVATIHLYRNSTAIAALANVPLRINGKKIKVKNGHCYELKVSPGSTQIRVRKSKHNHMTLDLEPGKEYYVKTFLRAGWFANKIELAEVTESFGQKQMTKLKAKNKKVVIL